MDLPRRRIPRPPNGAKGECDGGRVGETRSQGSDRFRLCRFAPEPILNGAFTIH